MNQGVRNIIQLSIDSIPDIPSKIATGILFEALCGFFDPEGKEDSLESIFRASLRKAFKAHKERLLARTDEYRYVNLMEEDFIKSLKQAAFNFGRDPGDTAWERKLGDSLKPFLSVSGAYFGDEDLKQFSRNIISTLKYELGAAINRNQAAFNEYLLNRLDRNAGVFNEDHKKLRLGLDRVFNELNIESGLIDEFLRSFDAFAGELRRAQDKTYEKLESGIREIKEIIGGEPGGRADNGYRAYGLDKKHILLTLSQEELKDKVVVPLLDRLGYKEAAYAALSGKDMVCSYRDNLENKIYFAFHIVAGSVDKQYLDSNLPGLIKHFFANPAASSDESPEIEYLYIFASCDIDDETRAHLKKKSAEMDLRGKIMSTDRTHLIEKIDMYMKEFWYDYDCFGKYLAALERELESIGEISALGKKGRVEVSNIYVPVKFIKKYPDGKDKSPELIKEDEFLAKIANGGAGVMNKLGAPAGDEPNKRFVVLGNQGSGKTTFLKNIALLFCENYHKNGMASAIPIFVTLRDFIDSRLDLRTYIKTVMEKHGSRRLDEYVGRELEKGNAIILLDGFDELITTQRHKDAFGKIADFIRDYSSCVFLISTRPTSYNNEFSDFVRLEIMDFDNGQIESFITKWFGREHSSICHSMLRQISNNEKIRELARNPLMLSIIAVVYEENRNKLPRRRFELYERCVGVQLKLWDQNKGIQNAYDENDKKFILRKIAYYCHVNKTMSIAHQEVRSIIYQLQTKLEVLTEDIGHVWDEICLRAHLMVKDSSAAFKFPHLSFQEYFTALELKERDDGLDIIMRHIYDPFWEEAIMLYCGAKMDGIEALIKRLGDQDEDIFSTNLLMAGRCIGEGAFTNQQPKLEIIEKLYDLYASTEFDYTKNKILSIIGKIYSVDPVVEKLGPYLESGTARQKNASSEVLGYIRSGKAVDKLLEALYSEEKICIRLDIVKSLAQSCDERAVTPLLDIMSGAETRKLGLEDSIGRILEEAYGNTDDANIHNKLLEAFNQKKYSNIRIKIVETLGRARCEKAADVFSEALGRCADYDAELCGALIEALMKIGSAKAEAPLLEAVRTAVDNEVRANAATALGFLGGENTGRQLADMLVRESDENVRECMLEAIARIGSPDLSAALPDLAHDKSRFVRGMAALCLGASTAPGAAGHLAGIINDAQEDAQVRAYALSSLFRLSFEKAFALSLKILETETNTLLLSRAIHVVKHAADESNISCFTAILEKKDAKTSLKVDAILALGYAGNRSAVQFLIKTLAPGEDENIKSASALVLGNIGDKSAFPAIASMLMTDPDAFVRMTAAGALYKIDKQQAEQVLLDALELERSGLVQKLIASLLGNYMHGEVIEALRRMLANTEKEYDLHAREEAFISLERISRTYGVRFLRPRPEGEGSVPGPAVTPQRP